ncbi:MAG: class I SAM-dependent methyltransferase [Dissulfurispiraceae bacterium]
MFLIMRPESKAVQFDAYWNALRLSSRFHPANRFRYFIIQKTLNAFGWNVKRIFDLGCGDGSLLQHLKRIFPDAKLYGADISLEQVLINRQNLPNMEFINIDGGSSHAPDILQNHGFLHFDLIACSEVIEHVSNDSQLIKNTMHLLRPGGLFILTTQSGQLFRMDGEILGHLRHYRSKDLVRMVTDAGYKIVHIRKYGFPVLSLQKRVVELFFDRVVLAIGSGSPPSRLSRFVMDVMYYAMYLMPPIGGPQIVLIARKPENGG